MIHSDVKLKKRTSKFLKYVIIIACLAVVLHILNPSIVSEVPRLVVSETPIHERKFFAHDESILTFDERRENIHVKYGVKKNIEKILANNVGVVTIFTKHAHDDTYIIAFSHGLLYSMWVEIQEEEGKEREIITDFSIQLSTVPIASAWYRSFIVVLSTDDKGNAFLHMLKKNKRKNSLQIVKTIQAPFAVKNKNSLYATNSAVFIYAQNTVYVLEKNTIRVYEKNVCSLSSVEEDESFVMMKFLYSTDGISCKSSSASLNSSRASKDYVSLNAVEKRIRFSGLNMEWNLLPMPHALTSLGTIYLNSAQNEYLTFGNQANHHKFSYTYGEKNYTIALR